ncbi:MAG: sulfatase-like hydrolase/transferase, partial [Acidobacteriota bacterium]
MSSSNSPESRPELALADDSGASPATPSFTRRLAFFVLNAIAFWAAEMLSAVTPLDAEPASMLVGALGLHVATALVAALAWIVLSGLLPESWRRWPIVDDRLVAFAPGVLLVVTLIAKTLRAEPLTGIAVLAALALVAGLLVWTGRGVLAMPAYAAAALTVWLMVLRFKAEADVLEAKSRLGTLPTSLLVVLVSAALLWSVTLALAPQMGRWRRIGPLVTTLGFVGVAAGRLLSPAPFEPSMDGDGGLRGRGTPVIVVILDTARADHLSVYGYPRPTTPALERFAADAVVHEHAVSTSSWTLPSHASLFTGLFPLGHGALRLPGLEDDANELAGQGIHRPAYPLPPTVPTLAEWFKGWRYDTAAFLSNFAYLDPAFGVHRGFDTYFNVRNTPVNPRILRVTHRRIR